VTDWIVAVSGVFAAVGTVGAVVVALWQSQRRDRRSLKVTSWTQQGTSRQGQEVPVIWLRGTNDGHRPIKVPEVFLATGDGGRGSHEQVTKSDALPRLVEVGESVDVGWERSVLELAADETGASYRYGFFVDTLGNIYEGPLPGFERKRSGILWGRRTDWRPANGSVVVVGPGHDHGVDRGSA
jgi:hypothetical protein